MKRISPDLYADAFVAALAGGQDAKKTTERFVATIRKHNDWSRRHDIANSCEKKLRRLEGRDLITIESARELSPAQKKKLAALWETKKCDIEYRVNKSLIAGVKIIINDNRELDGSLKQKLAKIFS